PSLGCRHGLLPEGLLCMERETTLGLFGRNVSGIFPDDRAEGGIRSTRGLTNGFRSPRGRRTNGDATTRGNARHIEVRAGQSVDTRACATRAAANRARVRAG